MDSPTNRVAAEKRLLQQMRSDESLHVVKVVDPEFDNTIIGYCMWFIYPHQRSKVESEKPFTLLTCDWVEPQEQREKAKSGVAPILEGRRKNLGGRSHGLLMYLCVHPATFGFW